MKLLLVLALGTCSPLVALTWRLALGWRSPDAPASVTIGGIIVALLIAVNAVAVALLIAGLLQGDGSMVAPLLGALVGAATLLVLRLPRWRRLPATTRLIGAMNAGYVACTLAALATFARSPTPGWWLLAWGALVATAEIGLLPREEG